MPTTVTKTIGTGGDYTTLQAWEDASPANLVTSDQIWRGECFNQEFFSSSSSLLTVSGTTTDATRYKELTTYAGASFVDNASVQTNALRYNASNGAGIRNSYAWDGPVSVNESYFRISKLQIAAGNAVGFNGTVTTGLVIDKCIFENSSTGNEPLKTYGVCTVKNSLIVQRSTATCAALSNGTSAYNCTFVRTGSSTSNIFTGSYSTSTLKNCAFFGGATTLASGSSSRTYTTCYTDTASPPSGCTTVAYDTSTGSGFENKTDATRDFRIKAGSALLDVGTTDTTNAAYDIVGTARPQGAAYDVGCWELVAGTGSPTLTGQAAVAGIGTLTPVMAVILTGLGTAVAQGSVGPVFGLPLTGQATAAAQGALTPASSVPLTGQAVVAAQGSTGPVISVALTGQATAVAQGSVLPAMDVPLTGQAVTVAQGTLTVSGSPDITLPLTGQATVVAQGSLLAQTSVPLTGQAVAVAQGVVLPQTERALTGNPVTIAQGALLPQTSVALAGQAVVADVGTMVAPGDVTVALTGVGTVVDIGTMTGSVTPDPGNGKSGVNRMWLIEYYTKEFAKKAPIAVPEEIVGVAAKRNALNRAKAVRAKQIEALAAKAESDLEALAQGVEDVRAAQQFTYNLIHQAQRQPEPEIDFMRVADSYRKRMKQEDDDLMLFAMVI